MQLKYNRQQGIGSSIAKMLIKLALLIVLIIVAIFLIEKVNFPSPKQNLKIEITNEIEKLK